MNQDAIIQAIEQRVTGGSYSSWTIGITEDPETRRRQHSTTQDTQYWKQWQADSEDIARYVEKYFLDKGMKGGTGGGDHPTFVYTF